tara:strand:+ start:37 stop:1212 length:1176 start_codon:yes stop_codon:yes gene_type:complete
MAETEQKLEALEKSAVAEASANPQADAPKKNAVAAEPSKLSNSAEDLGPAVVKPTDSNPDATKKTKQVSGDPQQKSQGSADAMPKLKEEEVEAEGSEIKEGEMPKAALDALKKSQDKKEKSEEADAKDKEKKDETMMKASYKKEDINVSDHVDALVSGESDLSEDFKNKAATIFETAIKSKVAEIAESMEADYNEKLEQESAKAKSELTEKVDSYLSYVVEEWMKENEIALERGIKGEIAEDFISGLKKLFSEHYIDVPDEKYDVLEAQATKIETLEKKLNEQIEKNVELNKDNSVKSQKEIMAEVANDLADTQKEKFAKLAEEIEYSTAEDFKKKCETIKESYFGQKAKADEALDDVAAAGETSLSNEDLSKAMAAYTAAISKTKDIKIS